MSGTRTGVRSGRTATGGAAGTATRRVRSTAATISSATASKIAARAKASDMPWASTRCWTAVGRLVSGDEAALLVAVPKAATSTARPSDPPTCCITLTMLEAAPESCGRTPARDTVVSGTNTTPMPIPNISIGGNTPVR